MVYGKKKNEEAEEENVHMVYEFLNF